jgi:hypothetical protein
VTCHLAADAKHRRDHRSPSATRAADPGLTVSLEALSSPGRSRTRGATFAVEGDNLVVEGPRSFLTEPDLAAIRRWRAHLKAIATYHAPEVIE